MFGSQTSLFQLLALIKETLDSRTLIWQCDICLAFKELFGTETRKRIKTFSDTPHCIRQVAWMMSKLTIFSEIFAICFFVGQKWPQPLSKTPNESMGSSLKLNPPAGHWRGPPLQLTIPPLSHQWCHPTWREGKKPNLNEPTNQPTTAITKKSVDF